MPGRLDETRPFLPVNIALLTVSDTRTEADDRSGNALAEWPSAAGHRIAARRIVRDDHRRDRRAAAGLDRRQEIDVVIATGGTGVTGRDVTPEAFPASTEGNRRVRRAVPLAHLRQDRHLDDPEPRHRRVAGGTYCSRCPARPAPAATLAHLVHQLDNRFRPCNFVELMPRLQEHKAA